MKRVLFLCLILFIDIAFSQTSLVAGDVAIVGINCDDPDDFAFVLLTDIETNTVINFTDNGWLAAGGFRTGEGVIAYTAPSYLSAGTVIIYSINSTYFNDVSGSFLFSATGDQIIAFQGDISSPILIYALNDNGNGVWQADATDPQTSALPPSLTNGYSAVALVEIDNAYYSGGANADLNALRLLISDNSNWTGDNTNGFNFSAVISNPLPVELSSFSAIVLDKGVKLKWRTETEVNNYGFEILRSAQNDNWLNIGFVQGNGNSNSPKNYSFIDENVSAGKYLYRLKQIDTDGQFEYSKIINVDLNSPAKLELGQNYPNPFNPTTTISFTLPNSGEVRLTVYNSIGEQVAEIINSFKEAGIHTINFDGAKLMSGAYFYKLEIGYQILTKKMLLVK